MPTPMSDDASVALLARRLPKAELHAHHTGSLRPSALLRLARRRPQLLPEGIDALFDNRGPAKFFRDLDRSAEAWGDERLLRASVVDVAAASFDVGVRHLELLVTPALYRSRAGLDVHRALSSLDAGFQEAVDLLNITGGLVVEFHRSDGPTAAEALVTDVLRARDAGVNVLGIGNDGDHRTRPLESLAPAYERAISSDLHTTGHIMTRGDLAVALDLGFDRLDHGWLAADDARSVRRLVESGATMTFTPMAYMLGGHQASQTWVEAYRTLHEAGVPLVIGTDDPALHHTDLAHSYQLLASAMQWGPADIALAAKRSFSAAWGLSEEAMQEQFRSIDALLESPRSPKRAPRA